MIFCSCCYLEATKFLNVGYYALILNYSLMFTSCKGRSVYLSAPASRADPVYLKPLEAPTLPQPMFI